jgi:hypothetical protein
VISVVSFVAVVGLPSQVPLTSVSHLREALFLEALIITVINCDDVDVLDLLLSEAVDSADGLDDSVDICCHVQYDRL